MCNFLHENENVENGKTRVYMTAIFEFRILHTVLTWELNQLIKIIAAIKPVEANKENHLHFNALRVLQQQIIFYFIIGIF